MDPEFWLSYLLCNQLKCSWSVHGFCLVCCSSWNESLSFPWLQWIFLPLFFFFFNLPSSLFFHSSLFFFLLPLNTFYWVPAKLAVRHLLKKYRQGSYFNGPWRTPSIKNIIIEIIQNCGNGLRSKIQFSVKDTNKDLYWSGKLRAEGWVPVWYAWN